MKRIAFAALCVIVVPISQAEATQGVLVAGPIGATDLGNAYLPKTPGFYLGLTDYNPFADRRFSSNGDRTPGVAQGNVPAVYLMYEWPVQLLGFKIASGLQTGYEAVGHVTVPGRPEQQLKGWRDLYVDLLNVSHYVGPLFGERTPLRNAAGQLYGLTVKAEYSMIFPIGHYDPNAISSTGSGTTFFIPNAAFTYLTPPDIFGKGLELDLHVFYEVRTPVTREASVNAEPVAANYFNGDAINIDYAVAQKFGSVTVGAAGSYTFQVNRAEINLSGRRTALATGGNFAQRLTVGPIVQIALPSIHGTFKIKAPIAVAGKNLVGSSAVVGNLFFPL